jgi:hypothetical protein
MGLIGNVAWLVRRSWGVELQAGGVACKLNGGGGVMGLVGKVA